MISLEVRCEFMFYVYIGNRMSAFVVLVIVNLNIGSFLECDYLVVFMFCFGKR